MPAIGDLWKGWRDALLASPRFHRLSRSLPLTRSIAGRKAEALFDLCAGFVYAQVLAACVRLDLFEILADGPASEAVLAPRLGLSEDAAGRLLAAAAALRLVERRSGGRWGLGEMGALVRGVPGVAEMVRHHGHLYADLADPVALLRGEAGETELGRFWRYARAGSPSELGEPETGPYSALMAASHAMIAEETLAAYPVDEHRCLMDVGGGEGVFLAHAARRAHGLRLMLFDLPSVAARARGRLAEQGLAARAETHGGDFLVDPLPAGADLISLIRVLHDQDDAAAARLLRSARQALPQGGVLLVSEPMAGDRRPRRVGDAYFGLYMLAMGAGRPRSAATLTRMMRDAGFTRVTPRRTRRPFLTSILVAQV